MNVGSTQDVSRAAGMMDDGSVFRSFSAAMVLFIKSCPRSSKTPNRAFVSAAAPVVGTPNSGAIGASGTEAAIMGYLP